MHTDEDSQTTLSKWPFIVGDVVLVATALAIAILGGWQLTDWQVAACVTAVALGAALFVLPYVVEFKVRVREEQEDRAAELRALKKHLQDAEQALAATVTRIRALESAVAEADRHSGALADVADQKFEQLESARAAQEQAIQQINQKLEALPENIPPPIDPERLDAVEKRLKVLEAQISAMAQAVEVSARPQASTPGPAAQPQETPPEKPTKTVAPKIDRPKRSARERRGPQEARLLHRAISENGHHSSAAVSRIIESKAKAAQPEPPVEEENAASSTADEATAASEPEPAEVTDETVAAPSPSEEETGSAQEATSQEAVPPAPAAEEEAESAAESLDALLEQAESTSPLPRSKAKKNDAVVTASVFIGIGNKPYLRGSGGGLSWEEGVAMDFQEIGKWQWIAPADLDQPLEIQVFRNDEDPDNSGRYTLEPGQKLEISPVF